MRETFQKLHAIISTQFGWDPRKSFLAIIRLPRFACDWWQFRQGYKGPLYLMPCLHDRHDQAGAANGEYFWQDFYVARKIHAANPEKHVDIGSRIDGFVTHVASFREIEVLDVRPIDATLPGVTFRRVDLQIGTDLKSEYCDSLSCLHALEHFGLGRYGDPMDPAGHEVGLRNMLGLLKTNGLFYLSVPIGKERVEFNGYRVLSPGTILRLADEGGLSLKNFAYVDAGGVLEESSDPMIDLKRLGTLKYALGIFTFIKV